MINTTSVIIAFMLIFDDQLCDYMLCWQNKRVTYLEWLCSPCTQWLLLLIKLSFFKNGFSITCLFFFDNGMLFCMALFSSANAYCWHCLIVWSLTIIISSQVSSPRILSSADNRQLFTNLTEYKAIVDKFCYVCKPPKHINAVTPKWHYSNVHLQGMCCRLSKAKVEDCCHQFQPTNTDIAFNGDSWLFEHTNLHEILPSW